MNNSTPVTFDADFSPSLVLQCPKCSSSNLHQNHVHAFWRSEEDSDDGIAASSCGEHSHVSGSMENNPSPRRNGITISFVCEGCGFDESPLLNLHIIQHKGCTYFEWEKVESNPVDNSKK